MTNRILATVVSAALVLSAALHAQSAAPAQAPAQAPPASQPPQQPPQPSTASPQAPNDLYQLGRDRVTPPKPTRQVNPAYTPDAIRNRIQGKVRLRAVVEREGTVSSIEVVDSLDKQFGLDQAAIDAFQQWRFEPGRLDGNPVRVLVTADLTFTLRDSPPTQGWPEGFRDPASLPGGVEEVAEEQGMRLRVTRPGNWTTRRTGPPTEWLSLARPDKTEGVSILRPDTVPFELQSPVSDALVQRVTETLRRMQPAPETETLATGQVQQSPGVSWVWSILRIPKLPNPPGTTDQTNPYAEARLWAFARTIDGRIVIAQCTVLLPRGADPSELEARAKQAAMDFAPIVNSVQVETVEK